MVHPVAFDPLTSGTTADVISGLEDVDFAARARELERRGETRKARADDDDPRSADIPIRFAHEIIPKYFAGRAATISQPNRAHCGY